MSHSESLADWHNTLPGISDDEGAEDRSNSSSRASNTNGGGAGADELGSGVDVSLGGGGGEQLGGLGHKIDHIHNL